jgi:hypothetical protein
VAGNQANILQNTASNEANALTGAAAAQAGGIVGAANARGASAQNILDLGGQIGGAAMKFFSDPRLKTNIVKTGTENGHNIYTWKWNDKASELGLFGLSAGVMADEINAINPEAITIKDGYMMVDYKAIGVKH